MGESAYRQPGGPGRFPERDPGLPAPADATSVTADLVALDDMLAGYGLSLGEVLADYVRRFYGLPLP